MSDILQQIMQDYHILEIDWKRQFGYDSIYFDSDCRKCYSQHHQGKRHRVKIRTRSYTNDNSLTFFEVKLKKKKKTHKIRFSIPRHEHGQITTSGRSFLDTWYQKMYKKKFEHTLTPNIAVYYDRLTFVHKQSNERLTIDFNLKFDWKNKAHELKNSVIIESKSDQTHGPSKYLLKELGIKSVGSCSKYCIGNIMLNGEKHNRFRELVKKIKKLERGQNDKTNRIS